MLLSISILKVEKQFDCKTVSTVFIYKYYEIVFKFCFLRFSLFAQNMSITYFTIVFYRQTVKSALVSIPVSLCVLYSPQASGCFDQCSHSRCQAWQKLKQPIISLLVSLFMQSKIINVLKKSVGQFNNNGGIDLKQ